jgi:sterol desaturase/sphingolipid hydroxylase (fatty acid hydroxylase superfamily)
MDHHTVIRLGFFFGVLTLVALVESWVPRRQRTVPRFSRWISNLILVFLNPLIVRFLFPLLAIDMAVKAQENGWGVLNHYEVPFWLGAGFGVLALDFIIYLQHIMFHAVPLLWRLHMVHHADVDFDVTTGLRFHPIEIVISMVIKLAAVAVLGPPVLAVLIFEVLLNATAMFNHSNMRLPVPADTLLRFFVVTPDMHRVHHSIFPQETNSNFGFNLPWWDRLFGTYRAQPAKGHDAMTIGLHQFPNALSLPRLLLLPFAGKTGRYAIGQRGAKASTKNTDTVQPKNSG